MTNYEEQIRKDLTRWQREMQRSPGVFSRLSKRVQIKINSWIPEKIHRGITATIKQMVRAVLFGAKYTSARELPGLSFEAKEDAILDKIKVYQNTAAIEGGVTGAGGLLLGLADFPILLGIKLKLLFDIAAMYGFDVKDYKERVYIFHIFELAFSSPQHRKQVYLKIAEWQSTQESLPANIDEFDWRNFQQEYRDYIDLAKLAQLIPVIGAPVGFIVNHRLVKKLGETAMNAYRMRLVDSGTG